MTEAVVDRWHWTVERYDTAVAAGVFGPEPHVELVDGKVFEVPPMLPGHVSDTTLAFDRTVKLSRYARSAIAEAWIVSLPERVIHRFTDPRPVTGVYDTATVFGPGARIAGTTLALDVPVDAGLPLR